MIARKTFLAGLCCTFLAAGTTDAEESSEAQKNKGSHECKLCPRVFIGLESTSFGPEPVLGPRAVVEESQRPTVTHEGVSYEADPYNRMYTPWEPGLRIGLQPVKRIPISFGLINREPQPPSQNENKKWEVYRQFIPEPDIAYVLGRIEGNRKAVPFIDISVPLTRSRKQHLVLEAVLRSKVGITYIATKETFGKARYESPDARVLGRGQLYFQDYGIGYAYRFLGEEDYLIGEYRVFIRKRYSSFEFPGESFVHQSNLVLSLGIDLSFGRGYLPRK